MKAEIETKVLRDICYYAVRRRDRAITGFVPRYFLWEGRSTNPSCKDSYACIFQGPEDCVTAWIADAKDDPYDVSLTIVEGEYGNFWE